MSIEMDENAVEQPFDVPTWDALSNTYGQFWAEEKEKFYNMLKENFRALTTQRRSGRQEIFELSVTPYSKHYERAFRDLFKDTGYQATVSESERLGTGQKKVKRLFITLPECFR